MKNLLNSISELIGDPIIKCKSLSGGDISNAYLIVTNSFRFFLKINSHVQAYSMFKAEKIGLESIAATHTIATPKVFHCGQYKTDSFLLLQYIETKVPTVKDFEIFANQLASLHKITTVEFGWKQNNFIGSLVQFNNQHKDWTSFYIEERLLPQLQLALSNGFLSSTDLPEYNKLYNLCGNIFQSIVPSLLHGDLWSGNYLIASDGTPYLIDPAVYYGHHEVDIAMSQLFGGFETKFYQTYQEHFNFLENTSIRIELYQLYYLLVHLNLFGKTYFRKVKSILTKYF